MGIKENWPHNSFPRGVLLVGCARFSLIFKCLPQKIRFSAQEVLDKLVADEAKNDDDSEKEALFENLSALRQYFV